MRILLLFLFIPIGLFGQGDSHLPTFQHYSEGEIAQNKIQKITLKGKSFYNYYECGGQGYHEFEKAYEFDRRGRLLQKSETGDPGPWRKLVSRYTYAGDLLIQSEYKNGNDPVKYIFYRYDEDQHLIRVESRRTESRLNWAEDGSCYVETTNTHDYPKRRLAQYDKRGNLLWEKEYKKGGLDHVILFKISRHEYDAKGRKISSIDSTVQSFTDTLNWNYYATTYEYNASNQVIRQAQQNHLGEKHFKNETTFQYSPDGARKSTYCSPQYEECQISFKGTLKDDLGRIHLDFNGYSNAAELTRVKYDDSGLLKSRITDFGELAGLDQMTGLPKNIEQDWKKERLDREELFEYEFFEEK